MVSRLVVLAVLVLTLAIFADWAIEQNEPRIVPERPAGDEPDLYMANALITQFDDRGLPEHRIKSARFTHFPLSMVTTLSQPDILLYQNDDAAPWSLTSGQGRILEPGDEVEEVVELWEQVLARRENADGHYVYIQTQSLSVYLDRNYVETDDKVFIDDNTTRTTASAMRAFLDDGRFFLYSEQIDHPEQIDEPRTRVHTILLPSAQ